MPVRTTRARLRRHRNQLWRRLEVLERRDLLTTIGFNGPYELQNWASTGIDGGTTSIMPMSGPSDTAAFGYRVDLGNPGPGVSNRTATFSLASSIVTGSVTFDYEFTGNHSYFNADASFASNGYQNNGFTSDTNGAFTLSGSGKIIATQGSSIGFTVGGSNGDSSSVLTGTLTITNFVAASSIVVDALGDSDDGDYTIGNLTLREAIKLTNQFDGADTISFDTNGVFATQQTITLTGGQLNVTDALTIEGPGRDLLTIDADDLSKVFVISDGVTATDAPTTIRGLTLTGGNGAAGGAIESFETLTIEQTTIQGSTASSNGGAVDIFGSLTVNDSLITGNSAANSGGGVRIAFGDLTVLNSTISDNTSYSDGGGVAFFGDLDANPRSLSITDSAFQRNNVTSGDGGGLHVRSADSVQFSNATVSSNTASENGGGVSLENSTAVISGSTFADNQAGSVEVGGGLFNSGGNTSISTSTFRGNSAHRGGGLANLDGVVVIGNSTFSGNNAGEAGGGIWNNTDLAGNLTSIQQTTVSGNTAATGGGLFNRLGLLAINYSTVTNNRADLHRGSGVGSWNTPADTRTDVRSTIVSGNADTDIDIEPGVGDNTFVSNGFNLIGAGEGSAAFTNDDLTGIAVPGLGQLGDNGGPTQTHAPTENAVVIDRGDPAAAAGQGDVSELDARGRARVFGGRIDIGAVEFNEFNGALIVDSLADGIDNDFTAGQFTLREAVVLSNQRTGNDEITFSTDLIESGDATITLTDGQIEIGDSTTITGPTAANLTVTAATASRVFSILEGETTPHDVAISNLTLTGGSVDSYGGAIFTRGNLAISNVTISGNVSNATGNLGLPTTGGGGIYGVAGTIISISSSVISGNSSSLSGGGVQGDIIYVTDSQISGNTAARLGGGLNAYAYFYAAAVGGRISITNSSVVGNSAGNQGGGIGGFDLVVTGSSVTGNLSAGLGGGLGAYNTTTVSDSTISGNSAAYRGGGIASYGNTTLTSTTLTGNTATGSGGGLFTYQGNAVVSFSTISANSSGTGGGGLFLYGAANTLTLNHAIVASNSVPSGMDSADLILSGSTNAMFSLIGTNSGTALIESASDANGNIIGGPIGGIVDPRLAALEDNGGTSLTFALLADSPALDAGDTSLEAGVGNVPEFDQRGPGFSRIAGNAIDIGAFENQLIASWHNADNPADVDDDGVVTPVDAILVINELNDRQITNAQGELPTTVAAPPFLDVEPNGIISPVDALLVINALPNNNRSAPLNTRSSVSYPTLGRTDSATADATLREHASHIDKVFEEYNGSPEDYRYEIER